MNQHRVVPEAAERVQARDLAVRLGVHALGRVHNPWPFGRRGPVRLRQSSPIDLERMADADSMRDPHWKAAPEWRMERVVMADRRYARQQVLEAANPDPILERVRAGERESGIGAESWLKVRNPFPDVGVGRAPLHARKGVQLEMIVSIDEPGHHDRVIDVDNLVALLRRRADAVNDTAAHPQRSVSPPITGQDQRVHERHRLAAQHNYPIRRARTTIATGSSPGANDGSFTHSIFRPAAPQARV